MRALPGLACNSGVRFAQLNASDTVAYQGRVRLAIRHRITIERAGMETDDGTARWIAVGLDGLAEGGIDAVRVEVVAERLGVTKGGVYRRFKDRGALLDAILERWSSGRIAAVDQQFALDGASPAERLRSLVRLYSERVSAQGIAVELAIRQ